MSDSGVEAGSDADSLGEMSVGSSVSSNEAVDQAILQVQAGDHEHQIQVDDHHPPDHVQQANMQVPPDNQVATAMQQVVQAVAVSSANQQQIHLSISHPSNATSHHHQFHLQMPTNFDHSFQFNQSRPQSDLLQSVPNDVCEDVEITYNSSFHRKAADETSDNEDESNLTLFRRHRPCSTKTPAPSPTSPPIPILKTHHTNDQSNSPGPSSVLSNCHFQKNLFANISWNCHDNSTFSCTSSPDTSSSVQNDWSKYTNAACAFQEGESIDTNGHNHEANDDDSVTFHSESHQHHPHHHHNHHHPVDQYYNHQHEYCGKMRSKKKLWSSKSGHMNTFGSDFLNKKLRTAANLGDVALVKHLLDQGAEACSCDARSRTSLHFAACKGEISIAQLLLEHGADPNLQDVLGNTPLHLAACTNNTSMVTLLLKYGTDVTVLDKSGRTPLHLAESKLKILQTPGIDSSSSSPTNLKMQVLQVIEMIQIYLQRSGKHAAASALGKFTDRLQSHQTKQEVDMDVQDLLASLNHMSLG